MNCPISDVFDVVDGLEIMPEVAILLRANVGPRPHRLPAHGASRPAGGNHRRGFRTQVSRLLPSQRQANAASLSSWLLRSWATTTMRSSSSS